MESETKLENHYSYFLFQCLIAMADCLKIEQCFEKTSNFCEFVKEMLMSFEVEDIKGFFTIQEISLYQSLVCTQIENYKLCHPGNYLGLFQYFREIYVKNPEITFPINSDFSQTIVDSLDIMEEMEENFNNVEFQNPQFIDVSAKIIVDQGCKKSILDGTFHLPDLKTALKIAKQGDTIFVTAGQYVLEDQIELTKDIKIIGEGPNKTTIQGSFLIKSSVEISNLKLEIVKKGIYLTGQAKFQCCYLNSEINTVFYQLSEQSQLTFTSCILDGASKVSRFLCMSSKASLNIDGNLVKDMFSFCSVIDQDSVCHFKFDVQATMFQNIQDTFKIVVNPKSTIDFKCHQSTFILDFLDPDLDSHAIFISSQGKVQLMNVSIIAGNADLKGIYCEFLEEIDAKNVQISGHDEGLETTSIGQGLTLQNVESINLDSISFSNLRIGVDIRNKNSSLIKVQEVEIFKCSVGIQIDALNSNIVLVDFLVEQSYYGLKFSSNSSTSVIMSQCHFSDVAKSMIIHKDCSNLMIVKESNYEFPSVEEFDEDNLEETLRRKLYIEYSSKLPFRIAYDHEDFKVISTLECELEYFCNH